MLVYDADIITLHTQTRTGLGTSASPDVAGSVVQSGRMPSRIRAAVRIQRQHGGVLRQSVQPCIVIVQHSVKGKTSPSVTYVHYILH